eukprot:GHVL01043937.1.p1 GENE.GHVL01043937.1~~GHVL01043937.1.p1  ORF type:complete len:508 (+),score=85.51 GHVL01043937.1:809-2332(+)
MLNILSSTKKCGGVYLFSNQQGCDGGRLYFDGCCMIAVNGKVLSQGTQFSPMDVEVVCAVVDLFDVRSARMSIPSASLQAANSKPAIFRVYTDFSICKHTNFLPTQICEKPLLHDPMEEIALGPACWMWDYLRRSGASGFFIPLSGGADSSSVLTIAGSMCQIIYKCLEIEEASTETVVGSETIKSQIARITGVAECPKSHKELTNLLIHTAYMSSENSSNNTKELAKKLAEQTGSYHLSTNIDVATKALVQIFLSIFPNKTPKFKSDGGSACEDLALQNIQARIRMVLSYLLASLFPWARGRKGFLLVLGTGNVDECLRGYLTKYDCSSADINPIGAISKIDLLRFLKWSSSNLGYTCLSEVIQSPPTAELRPPDQNGIQNDEVEMGISYEEIGWFGRLRKIERCGPASMFKKLMYTCTDSPAKLAEKVKHFFRSYAINRHKVTTITPSYHAENYAADDNRFDLRPFLYPPFIRQFSTIDKMVKNHNWKALDICKKLSENIENRNL